MRSCGQMARSDDGAFRKMSDHKAFPTHLTSGHETGSLGFSASPDVHVVVNGGLRVRRLIGGEGGGRGHFSQRSGAQPGPLWLAGAAPLCSGGEVSQPASPNRRRRICQLMYWMLCWVGTGWRY
jgi:hypothetical protein